MKKHNGRTPEQMAEMRKHIRPRPSDADVLRRIQAAIDRHDPAAADYRRRGRPHARSA